MKLLSKGYRFPRRVYRDFKRTLEFRRARRLLLASEDLTVAEKRLLNRVSLRVHPADQMNKHRPQLYLTAGLSARRCIQSALHAAGRGAPPGTILDFPCGYGRVLRFLRVMFPHSQITGAEVNPPALDFCRRVFSADVFLSNTDIDGLSLPRKFDLIWCGSLITHIDEQMARSLLRFFHLHLSGRGVCIFTTHGRGPVEWIKKKQETYKLNDEGQQKVVYEFEEKGYGYADYPRRSGFGVAAFSRSRVVELARSVGKWDEVYYLENGWHTVQDVYAFAPTN